MALVHRVQALEEYMRALPTKEEYDKDRSRASQQQEALESTRAALAHTQSELSSVKSRFETAVCC